MSTQAARVRAGAAPARSKPTSRTFGTVLDPNAKPGGVSSAVTPTTASTPAPHPTKTERMYVVPAPVCRPNLKEDATFADMLQHATTELYNFRPSGSFLPDDATMFDLALADKPRLLWGNEMLASPPPVEDDPELMSFLDELGIQLV